MSTCGEAGREMQARIKQRSDHQKDGAQLGNALRRVPASDGGDGKSASPLAFFSFTTYSGIPHASILLFADMGYGFRQIAPPVAIS